MPFQVLKPFAFIKSLSNIESVVTVYLSSLLAKGYDHGLSSPPSLADYDKLPEIQRLLLVAVVTGRIQSKSTVKMITCKCRKYKKT